MSGHGCVNCPDCGTTFYQYESACPKCGCPVIYAQTEGKSKTRCRIMAIILCILGCVCLYNGYTVMRNERYQSYIEQHETYIQGYIDNISASNNPVNSIFRAEYRDLADGYIDLINSNLDSIWAYRMKAIRFGVGGLILFIGAGFLVYKKKSSAITGVRCPNCQSYVSNRADQCPRCGQHITVAWTSFGSSNVKEKTILYVVTVLLICAAASMGISLGMSNEKNGIRDLVSQEYTNNVDTNYSYEYAFGETEDAALDKAVSYLNTMPFSYQGLVEQLEFGGFSHYEAVDAVDRCGADWNEQAVKSAKDYLETMPFSYDGLINQLEYVQFTKNQAKYGVDHCGADWNEQAVKTAEGYLEVFPDWTKSELRKQLIHEGFTSSQAEYGVNHCIR